MKTQLSSSIPEVSTCALPEEVDSNGSASQTSSDTEEATDDSASVLNSDACNLGDDVTTFHLPVLMNPTHR